MTKIEEKRRQELRDVENLSFDMAKDLKAKAIVELSMITPGGVDIIISTGSYRGFQFIIGDVLITDIDESLYEFPRHITQNDINYINVIRRKNKIKQILE